MKETTDIIVKKVKKLLDMGYRQILIRDGEIYACAGVKNITEEDIKTAPVVQYTEQ
jgi:hypothetical protein